MRVAVVGLGLAGLRAAQLLERAGIDVALFDARSRVGGRVHTVEDVGRPSHEAGAQWIDADHGRVIALLRELGLEPRPRPEGVGLAILRGDRTSDAELWDDAARDEAHVEGLAKRMCRALPEPLDRAEELVALDRTDVASFLREHAASERGLAWLTAKYRADEGDDLDHVGLLGWLVGYQLYADREGGEMCALRLPIGGGALCRRLLDSLSAASSASVGPRLGHVLRGVETETSSVTLHFDGGRSERFDHAVLALPAPCIARLDFDPGLPPRQAVAYRAFGWGRAVKLAWEFDAPWWREDGWNGDLAWDGPLQQTWDGSIGEAHVLCAYVCGEDAAAFTREADPVGRGLDLLTSLFPEARRAYRRGWFHDWVTDPFSSGVHSHLAPGFVLDHLPHVAPPAGRVHFAGEHTATWTGFLEGALESASRVRDEVVAARNESTPRSPGGAGGGAPPPNVAAREERAA